MNALLTSTLFVKQNKQFEKIRFLVKSFAANFCGNVIIRDAIYEVVSNYSRKKDLPVEILRYPIKDSELWAFTFIKGGTVFLCVNSKLPLCKQIFATAHELYHIYCYGEEINTSALNTVLIRDTENVDDVISQEDLEANAFAGLLLMPDDLLANQMAVYGIKANMLGRDDVLLLMDLFAMPYKAVVCRLMECNMISLQKAQTLMEVDESSIQQQIALTGRAERWQKCNNITTYGSLKANMDDNIRNGLLIESRQISDSNRLARLNAYIDGISHDKFVLLNLK